MFRFHPSLRGFRYLTKVKNIALHVRYLIWINKQNQSTLLKFDDFKVKSFSYKNLKIILVANPIQEILSQKC